MYGKLYYNFYSFLRKKNNQDPAFNAACLLFISQIIHFFVFVLSISKISDFELPVFSKDNSDNKLAFFPIAIVWLILVHKFFENKVEFLTSKFKNEKKYNFYLMLLFSIFTPLYILIKLSGGSVWK